MKTDGLLKYEGVVTGLMEKGLKDLSLRFTERYIQARSSLFQAPVLGAMKSGKSSLLRKLLSIKDEGLLPKDVLQATAKPVYIMYQDSQKQLMGNPSTGEYEEIDDGTKWWKLITGALPLSDGARLEMGVNSEWLKPLGLQLIDTPGINSPTEGLHAVTWQTVPECKLALYVVAAKQLWTKADQDFIESVKHYAGAFIFIISRTDEIGCRRWNDRDALLLRNDLETKLEAIGVKPLEICIVSSTIKNDDDAGIINLRRAIKDAADAKREVILYEYLRKITVTDMQDQLSFVKSQKALNEQSEKMGIKEFNRKKTELEAKLIETEGAHGREANRMKNNCDAIYNKTLNDLYNVSKNTFVRMRQEVEGMQDYAHLQHYKNTIAKSQFDDWYNKCLSIMMTSYEDVGALAESAREELLADISKAISITFDEKMLYFPESELVPGATDDNKLSDVFKLQEQKKEIEKYILDINRTLQDDSTSVEMKNELIKIEDQLNAIEYVPQFDEKKYDRGAEAIKNFGKNIGRTIDIILAVAPVPIGKLKFLQKGGKVGQQLFNAAKKYNALARKKNVVMKKFIGIVPKNSGVSKFLDALSVEHWGEKLGGILGQSTKPDEVVKIENLEVKNQYIKQIKPYEDKMLELKLELVKAEAGKEKDKIDYNYLLEDKAMIDEKINQLKREDSEKSVKLQSQLELYRTEKEKSLMIGLLNYQLLDFDGAGWHGDMRKSYETEYLQHVRKTIASSEGKHKEIVVELKNDLNNIEARYGTDTVIKLEQKKIMMEQITYLEEACRTLSV